MTINKPNLEQHQGGSGFGWSHWKAFLPCPCGEEFTGSSSASTGTYFHWLMEQYYGHKIFPGYAYVPSDMDSKEWKEATRMFDAYTKVYKADEWTVLAIEKQIEAKTEDEVGIVPFTGRLDMLVSIDARQAVTMEHERGLVLEPGIYIVDHKTTSRQLQSEVEKYQRSIQFQTYLALTPEAKGVIVNIIQRNKVVDFRNQLVLRDEKHLTKIKAMLKLCKQLKEAEGL